jgi:hypothetical protein
MVYHMFTYQQQRLWKEKVGAAAPHPEALVLQVVAPRMDKVGAIARPEALVGAQGEVPSADSIQVVELLPNERCITVRWCATLMALHTEMNAHGSHQMWA